MPGSVQAADPETVMPWSLCRAFRHAREIATIENEYRNGESQRGRLVDTSRRSWQISSRLSASLLDTLRDFYNDRKGGLEPFYFYDVWETSPKFSYDPTGVETTGRFTVRFAGGWDQMIGMGRAEVNLAIIEIG